MAEKYFLIMYFWFVAEFKHGPIQADSFASYVKFMHTDGDYKFNQEFEVKSIIFMSVFVHCSYPVVMTSVIFNTM